MLTSRHALLLTLAAFTAIAAAPSVPTAPSPSSADGASFATGPTVHDANADGVRDTGTAARPAPRYAKWKWHPAADAPIHPGTNTVAEGAGCTSNFVFVRTEVFEGVEYLVDVLLGTAAHCISDQSGPDECQDEGHPIGTPVDVDGATKPAAAAYNATLSMQRVGETDRNTCRHNDVGMIRLHRDDWSRVNPSIPDFGGPVGTNRAGTSQGDTLYGWGNSSLRAGVEQTSPKQAVALGTSNGGWNHSYYAVTPGIPGDSGSPMLDADGRALAITSTISTAPFTASNNADDVGRAVAWAVANEPAMAGLRLEPGTEPWDPSGYPFLP